MIELIIGVAILFIYLLFVIVKDGKVPPSISDSFYSSGKYLFTFVMFAEAVLLTIALLSITPSNLQFLAFFSGASLAFVGAAPHCHEKFEKTVHFAGAYTFALGSQLWYWLVPASVDYLWFGIMFACAWIPAVFLIFKFKSNATFIAEIACVLVIVLGRVMYEVG